MEQDNTENRFAKEVPESGFLGWLVVRIGDIFAVLIVLSALALVFEVAMRYIFNSPTIWVHETVIFVTAITFAFGGLLCASTDKHIRVVLIYDALSGVARRILDVVISIVCAIATGLFATTAWTNVERALWAPDGAVRIERSGSAWNAPTPGLLKTFLFIVLIFLCVQYAILAFNYARKK